MTSLWAKWRALAVMGRHERWRVAMGCPGVPWQDGLKLDAAVPIRGEVYCRCDRCYAARRVLGWRLTGRSVQP